MYPSASGVNENSDYVAFYEPVAESILDGRGLTLPDGSLALRYPPGFPVLLAGLFASGGLLGISRETMLTGFLCTTTGLATVLLFLIARTIWPLQRALFAAACFATYPLLLWLAKQPTSEMPFLILLYGAVLFLVISLRRGVLLAALACGLGIGAATLIRPITILLGFAAAGLSLIWRRDTSLRTRAYVAALILLGNLLAVLPWELWMYNRTGMVIVVSTAGPRAMRDGLSFSGSRKSFREPVSVPSGLQAVVDDLEAELAGGRLKTYGNMRSFLGSEFRRHPLGVAEMVILKAARSWYATDSHRKEGLALGMQVMYLALIAYSGVRAYRAGGAMRQMVIVTSFVAAYFWFMTIIALSIARYMVPAIGLLFVLAPAALPVKASKT